MQKQTTPEVPQGLTPALNSFLRWVRDQLKGIAIDKANEAADKASTKAGKAQNTADGATTAAAKAQETANNATTAAATAQTAADKGITNASKAQSRADSAYSLADTANGTANTALDSAGVAQDRADEAYDLARKANNGAVHWDNAQNLTSADQAQARTNINAAPNVMATTSTGGQVIIGAGISVASDGTISVSGGGGSGGDYVLPAATTSSLGGIIVGSGLGVTGAGTLSVNASYATSANVSSIITSGGYATSSYVSSAVSGKITSAQAVQAVSGAGYVTSTYVAGATVASAGVATTAASCTGNAATATSATNAGTATKIGSTTIGGATKPVYVSSGSVVSCTYSLGKSVPADAVFTDTVFDDSNVVHLGGAETISGTKTFLQSVRADNGQTGNAAHSLGYGCNADGKAGIWDYTHSKWLILNDSGGNTTLADGAVTITSGLTVSGGMVVSGGITGSCTSAGSAASAGYAITAGTATSCTGNAATATDASSLGGVAAASYALNADVVKLSGNQTVSGTKTFTSSIKVQGTGVIGFQTSNTSYSRTIDLRTQDNGNAGIWDTENNRWMIHTLAGGVTEIVSGLNVTGDISATTFSGTATSAVTATTAASCTGNASTATNASSLGGVAASGYVTTSDINTITSAAPTYYSGFADYNANQKVMVYRNGHVCQLTGAAKASVAASGTGNQDICTIPEGYRPVAAFNCVQQGSGQNRFLLTVTTSGVVKMERYGVTSAIAVGSGAWLNVACTFICA